MFKNYDLLLFIMIIIYFSSNSVSSPCAEGYTFISNHKSSIYHLLAVVKVHQGWPIRFLGASVLLPATLLAPPLHLMYAKCTVILCIPSQAM